MAFSCSFSSSFLVSRDFSSSSQLATLMFLFTLYFLHLRTFWRFCSGISLRSAFLGPLVCLLGSFSSSFLVSRDFSSSSQLATLMFLFSLYFLHLRTLPRFSSGISLRSAFLGPLVCLLGSFLEPFPSTFSFSEERLGLAWIIS